MGDKGGESSSGCLDAAEASLIAPNLGFGLAKPFESTREVPAKPLESKRGILAIADDATTIWEAVPADGGCDAMEQVCLQLVSLPEDGADKEDCEAAEPGSAAPDAALGAVQIGVEAEEEVCDWDEQGSTPADAASEASADMFLGRVCSGTRRFDGSSGRHQRFSAKRKPCPSCGGPCREGHCSNARSEDAAPAPKLAKVDTDGLGSGNDVPKGTGDLARTYDESSCEAADTFLEVVKRLRDSRTAAAAAAAPAEPSSVAREDPRPAQKRGPPATAGTADCRKHRKVQVQLPRNFGDVPAWLRDKPKVGGVLLDPSHNLAWHRGVTWCWSCGTFALEVPNKLRAACEPPTVAGARQLVRLRLGLTPRNSVSWAVDTALPELNGSREGSNH